MRGIEDALSVGLGIVKIRFRKIAVVAVRVFGLDDSDSDPWHGFAGVKFGRPNKRSVTAAVFPLREPLYRNTQELLA